MRRNGTRKKEHGKQFEAVFRFLSASFVCLLLACTESPYPATGQIHSAAPNDSSVVVTYVANEGVLIAQGETQVLIDGLHLPYGPNYMPTPHGTVEKILNAEAPFTSLDFVLVSHVHGDHFASSLVSQLLDSNTEVQLFTSPQVLDSLSNDTGENSFAMNYTRGIKTTRVQGGARVTIGKVDHGSEQFTWVQNLGQIVEIGGLKFLHVGDPGMGEDDLEALDILDEEIDVAILPDWFLRYLDGRRVTNKYIKAKAYIAVHVSQQEGAQARREIVKHYPGATVFTESGQQVAF